LIEPSHIKPNQQVHTGAIASGALAPILHGGIADLTSRTVGILAAALTAAAIIPLVFALRLDLKEDHRVFAATEP
jgi:MFS transporter, FSR family, fosmidomycin resistance protein